MLKVTLKRSVIGYDKRQRATAKALGLNKIGSSAIHEDSKCIMGMIDKLNHVLEVKRLQDPVEVKE